jgi:hypothetical protein
MDAAPRCPYCSAALQKMPSRKTKCKSCGGFMSVKSTPADRTRRLMTADQAASAEAEWAVYSQGHELRKVLMWAGSIGVPQEQIARVQAAGLDAGSALDLLVAPRAIAGDRHALACMLSHPTDRRRWHLALVQHDLDHLRAKGYEMAVVRAPQHEHDPCHLCAQRDKSLIFTSASAPEVVPFQCEHQYCSIYVQPHFRDDPDEDIPIV